MSSSIVRRALLGAGACLFAIATLQPTAAQQPPGMSGIDKSNPAASQQDAGLKPHPTPPTVTPTEKIPVKDLKLFKCDVLWAMLDALHHAYVTPGHVPPGAFVPKA
jgi:hypothetical protein